MYKFIEGHDSPPGANLRLEYVFGFRSYDQRNNVKYTPTGQIVYHQAGIGVVLDPQSNTQRFMLEHNDDIISFAIRENIVVTG